MLKLPYAIRDFYALITEGYYYIDRTNYIAVLENLGKELLFLRPRRFGKSLWLSTLINYYDLIKADAFEQLFGQLAIGQNPTSLHNTYLVMKWDFSGIEAQGTMREIRQSLYNQINAQIEDFQRVYKDLLASEVNIHDDDALSSFASLLSVVRTSGHKLYLFIDEYDNFANEVMMSQRANRNWQTSHRERYDDLVSGEGLLKTLFKNIKIAGSGSGLDRLFMTGVSPIVMNDVTSGANVTKNVTWHPYLNDLCGFREAEVEALVRQIVEQCSLSQDKHDEIIKQMRIFYDGSRFITRPLGQDVDPVPQLYNPTLVFYFLEELQTFCQYPESMLDTNLTPDYNKLVYISGHNKGEKLLTDALDPQTSVTVSDLEGRWGVQDLLASEQQYERLATLLCYLGALTISGRRPDAKIILTIPNLVMRQLYAERILTLTFPAANERDEAKVAADALFAHGNIEPLCTFVEKHLLAIYSNRDYQGFNEVALKTLFITLLHYNNLYIMDSEPALRRQYGDLIMMIRPEMRHYSVFDLLIEFKFVPLSKFAKLSGQDIRQKEWQTLAQLTPVKKELAAAEVQLRHYRQTLEQTYRQALKLRTYAIVAVGFERLIWQEVI